MKQFIILVAATALCALASACKEAQGPIAPQKREIVEVTAPKDGDWTKIVRTTKEGGFMMGNPNSQVHLVEYGSLTCSHCADFAETQAPALIENYVQSGKVSFEFRNFIRDPLDIAAAMVIRCNGEKSYFQLTDSFYNQQQPLLDSFVEANKGRKDDPAASPLSNIALAAEQAKLLPWAAQNGIPSAKAKQCLTSQAELDNLLKMSEVAVKEHGLEGTPTFILNGTKLSLKAGVPMGESIAREFDGVLNQIPK